jgi:hypothetical protein
MSKVLVKWNKAHVWGIGTGMADSSVVHFVPGPNELPQEKWDLIKNHPTVKERIANKSLEVVVETKLVVASEESGEPVEEPSSSLSALSLKEAKELVCETFNTVLLKQWQAEEPRKGVLTAIEKQLAQIEKEREEAGKESKEEELDYEE